MLNLIASLPPPDYKAYDLIRDCKEISGVRYNVGTQSALAIPKLLKLIQNDFALKSFWIDLKGRQLRIAHWSQPPYGSTLINHNIKRYSLPAKAIIRNEGEIEISAIHGNQLYFKEAPKFALGDGQSLNIIADVLEIEGYLTPLDIEFMIFAKKLGIKNFMLSFVEEYSDLEEVYSMIPDAKLVLKIESLKGLEFVKKESHRFREDVRLMAARDDLLINIGANKFDIIDACKLIIATDPHAICASRIFKSIKDGDVDMGDISDIFLMEMLGYKNFMLSDNISSKYFTQAIRSWQQFLQVKQGGIYVS